MESYPQLKVTCLTPCLCCEIVWFCFSVYVKKNYLLFHGVFALFSRGKRNKNASLSSRILPLDGNKENAAYFERQYHQEINFVGGFCRLNRLFISHSERQRTENNFDTCPTSRSCEEYTLLFMLHICHTVFQLYYSANLIKPTIRSSCCLHEILLSDNKNTLWNVITGKYIVYIICVQTDVTIVVVITFRQLFPSDFFRDFELNSLLNL